MYSSLHNSGSELEALTSIGKFLQSKNFNVSASGIPYYNVIFNHFMPDHVFLTLLE